MPVTRYSKEFAIAIAIAIAGALVATVALWFVLYAVTRTRRSRWRIAAAAIW